jgi:hypothetical protein
MEMNLQSLLEKIGELAAWTIDQATQPPVIFQVILIALIYFASRLLARRSEPPMEAWARNIKDSPELLRIIISLLRRLEWFYFVLLVSVFWLLLTSVEFAQIALVHLALLFSMAWLIITVVTQTIRNRALRKLVAVTG